MAVSQLCQLVVSPYLSNFLPGYNWMHGRMQRPCYPALAWASLPRAAWSTSIPALKSQSARGKFGRGLGVQSLGLSHAWALSHKKLASQSIPFVRSNNHCSMVLALQKYDRVEPSSNTATFTRAHRHIPARLQLLCCRTFISTLSTPVADIVSNGLLQIL
jgi:hypothetical protein